MIKLDIINEVVNKTGITKTKAEMAVETVFESMKKSLGQGRSHRTARVRRVQRAAREDRHRAQPAHGRRSFHPAGKAVRFKPGKELQSID